MLHTFPNQRLLARPARFRRACLAAVVIASAFVTQAAADQLVRFRASKPFVSKPIMLEAELFKPSGKGPFPAVVLMHGCGGWQPAVIASLHMHAMDLLSRGYVVLNLDSFGPRDRTGGSVCSSLSELNNAVSYRTADAFDAQRYLQSLGYVAAENIFLMGQSNGGALSQHASNSDGRTPLAVG